MIIPSLGLKKMINNKIPLTPLEKTFGGKWPGGSREE